MMWWLCNWIRDGVCKASSYESQVISCCNDKCVIWCFSNRKQRTKRGSNLHIVDNQSMCNIRACIFIRMFNNMELCIWSPRHLQVHLFKVGGIIGGIATFTRLSCRSSSRACRGSYNVSTEWLRVPRWTNAVVPSRDNMTWPWTHLQLMWSPRIEPKQRSISSANTNGYRNWVFFFILG